MHQRMHDLIVKSVKRGYEHKISNGIYPYAPKIGYIVKRECKLVIDPKVREYIEEIFHMFLSGKTVSEINVKLSHAKSKNKALKHTIFNEATIKQVLSDPIYAGMMRIKDRGVLPAIHEPFISKKQYCECQRLLNK